MTEFSIKIAGITIAVSAMYDATREFCRDYLHSGTSAVSVTLTRADIDWEREISAREDRLEGHAVRNHSDAYLETIALQRKLSEKLFAHDVLLFHGSAIAVDGQCYLFTAKSGTGKSTHTRLWRQLLGERAVMVNDDKPFLKFEGDQVIACGSPWNGKHRLGSNIMVPLKSICILERGEENRIQRITAKDALQVLFQQSARPMNRALMGKYMELIDRLANSVEFYRLECNMDPEAAKLSYETMSGNQTD